MINQSNAGRFDLKVFVNCVQLLHTFNGILPNCMNLKGALCPQALFIEVCSTPLKVSSTVGTSGIIITLYTGCHDSKWVLS